jgi:hypothetical protein
MATPCKTIKCCDPNPFGYNVTSGTVYRNNQAGFTFECPPGYTCEPGEYPKTIVIGEGEIEWQPPPYDDTDPNDTILTLPCCTGVDLTVTVPAGSTQAEYDAYVQDLLQQWAAAEAGCRDEQGRSGRLLSYGNDAQQIVCADSENIQIDPGFVVPSFLTALPNGFVLAANIFRSSTKAQANIDAISFLNSFWALGLVNAFFQCVSCDLDDFPEVLTFDPLTMPCVPKATFTDGSVKWFPNPWAQNTEWYAADGTLLRAIIVGVTVTQWRYRVTLSHTHVNIPYYHCIYDGACHERCASLPGVVALNCACLDTWGTLSYLYVGPTYSGPPSFNEDFQDYCVSYGAPWKVCSCESACDCSTYGADCVAHGGQWLSPLGWDILVWDSTPTTALWTKNNYEGSVWNTNATRPIGPYLEADAFSGPPECVGVEMYTYTHTPFTVTLEIPPP